MVATTREVDSSVGAWSPPGAEATPWGHLTLDEPHRRFLHVGHGELVSRDPATGEVVATTAVSSPEDVDVATASAQHALFTTTWATDARLRSRVLFAFATALRADADRLAELLTREQGKTLRESRGEVAGSVDEVEYFAGLARALSGRSLTIGEATQSVVVREPIGVVAIVTPWNAPLRLLVRSVAPALAAGNAVVVKPASLTPAISVEALALLASLDGMPDGIVSCVLGAGATIGDALVSHPSVDAVSFTGDTSTGIGVLKRAADTLKTVGLELGGKSPNIVFSDADLGSALDGAVKAGFSGAGQICTSGTRLLVQDAIYDDFVAHFARRAEGLRVGNGLDPDVDVGPVVSDVQRKKILKYIECGRRDGRLVAGGTPIVGEPGFFVTPTIFADLPPDSSLLRDEIFGPVVCVQRFHDEADAIALANETRYGLAAGVWTTDLHRAWRVGRALKAGTVWINTYHDYVSEAESGGYKQSGTGVIRGIGGLEAFTETKHLEFHHAGRDA